MVIGAGLMTRQGVSYTICAFPAVAWLMFSSVRLRGRWVRGLSQLALAGVVAGVIWLPYLVVKEPPVELKRRVLYQDSFRGGPGDRLDIASRNVRLAFVPNWIGGDPREPNSGWLYLYMTPTLYGLGLAGLAYLAFRHPRVFVLLLVWWFLLIGPLIFLVSTIYSRYVLAGTPPMLVAAAFLLADITAMLAGGRAVGRVMAVVLWGFVVALPLDELRKQAFDWRNQTLTLHGEARSDRYQYITGWTAGTGTRDALAYLEQAAEAGPVVVITTDGWGTPADALWAYLDGRKNVQMFYVSDMMARPADEPGYYRVQSDKWVYPASDPKPVKFAPGARVFFVTNDPVHGASDVRAAIYFRGNSNLGWPKTFYGVDGENVCVFPVYLDAGEPEVDDL